MDHDIPALINGYLDDTLSQDRQRLLSQWIEADPDHARRFAAAVLLHDQLQCVMIAADENATDHHGACSPILGFLADSTRQAISIVKRPTPLSLSVAVVVVGAIVASLAFVYLPSSNDPVANRKAGHPLKEVATLSELNRVTWDETVRRPPGNRPRIKVGQRVSIKTGAVLVRYDTGTRVVLEGPAEYELTGSNGGYLRLGKLEAIVKEKNAQGFAVQSPVATVVDLGTVFGLIVDESGATATFVFEGIVELLWSSSGNAAQRNERRMLRAGQSAKVDSGELRSFASSFENEDFHRLLKPGGSPEVQKYKDMILADRPLAYWPLNDKSGHRRLLDLSTGKHHGRSKGDVEPGVRGPLNSPTSTAVRLDGTGMIRVGQHPDLGRVRDFTVEAWIWIDDPEQCGRVIVAGPIGGEDPHGWDLAYRPAELTGRPTLPTHCIQFTFLGAKAYYFNRTPIKARRWIHLAVVCTAEDELQLFIDGEHRESLRIDRRGSVGRTDVTIGRSTNAKRMHKGNWRGRLAHIAVYPRALSADRIRAHYRSSLRNSDKD